MLTLNTITDISEWDKLKNEWNMLLEQSTTHVPFLRHEFLREWWDTCGGGEWIKGDLVIVTAHDGDQLVGIAPLFNVKTKEGKRVLMLIGSFEIVDYLDIICKPEYMNQFLLLLGSYLTTSTIPEWDSIELFNILDQSPTLTAMQDACGKLGWKCEIEELQKAPYIPLPGNWEEYLAGIDKKQRHEIRRKMRRARESVIPVDWYVTREEADLEGDTAAFLDLMAQDPEKNQFLTPEMRIQMQNTIRCAFDTGCLHLAFLTIGNKKAAAYLSFDYLNRLWVYNSGLNRDYNEYSPGWVLLGFLLEWANENGYSEFDFLRGDEEYKYRFGAIDRIVYRMTISRE